MASKKTTYPLLAAVLVIWGIIGYRLLAPKPTERTAPESPAPAPARLPEADSLLANYRDPFLGGMPRSQRPAAASPVRALPPSPAPREAVKVAFYGSLAEGSKTYYLVSIDGRRHMLASGESAEGFSLAQVAADSVVLLKNGQHYTAKQP